MPEPIDRTRQASLVWYFLITFAVTWSLYFLVGTTTAGAALPKNVRELLFLPGTVAPAAVALIMTWRAEGDAGVRALLGRILRWRVGIRWYVIALGYMIAVKLAAAALIFAMTGVAPAFGETPVILMFAALTISTWVQAGEEIGWRGFALPRMAARLGLGPASMLLGLIWALWHLPLFLLPGLETSGQSFPAWTMAVIAISVALAWIYWRTGGSLLLVMLMHAAINNTKDIVPSGAVASAHPFTLNTSLMSVLTAGLMWACAAYFLIQMRGARSVDAVRTNESRE